MQLQDFYHQLQLRNGIQNPAILVAAWPLPLRAHIEAEMRTSMAAGGFFTTAVANLHQLPGGRARTNQSKGNVLADALCDALTIAAGDLSVHSLSSGRGYPDRRLRSAAQNQSVCFEIKATTNWDATDGNRRVLTSSPDKIRAAIASGELPSPPCHLVATIHYSDANNVPRGLRLDFLEPDTTVAVRLEASTSHQLLHNGPHQSADLP